MKKLATSSAPKAVFTVEQDGHVAGKHYPKAVRSAP